MKIKLVSWNVNGLRACVRKGFLDYFTETDADIFAVQEIKLQAGQIDLSFDHYHMYWNYAEKKGYSGTAVFTKVKPITVQYGMNGANSESEGRIITLEFADFYFVNVYTPNAQRDLARLPRRLEWDDDFYRHVTELEAVKPVLICGDLNVAHQEIDIKNAKANEGNSGFTIEERENFSRLLQAGFIDTFRYFKPMETDYFTWWSYMKTVRERNIGWRIDYFLTSQLLEKQLLNATIAADVYGSDHCPITLEVDF